MKIVVDAMGGDHAPHDVISGVVEALNEYNVSVALVGIKEQIETELNKHKYPKHLVEIVHAPEVVLMHDPAAASIRQKKNSSITIGMGLLKKPGYDAFFSAGNTGACVAAATFGLGLIPGVDRPGIGCILPTLNGFIICTDMGANTAAKPEHLLQYAKLSKVYANLVMGVKDVKVGLLNIGEEECKGTDLEKEAHKLLEAKEPAFIGNVEANEIYTGKAHVVVCDGYVGNVVLKTSEGLVEAMTTLLKREIKKRPLSILGSLLMIPAFKGFKKSVDYSEYGGAPLLGVNGLVLIGHGRSTPKAIKHAIRAAIREVEHDLLVKLKEEVLR